MQTSTSSIRRAADPKRRRKLGEIVADHILSEIIHKSWPEGEVIGTEADFMEKYRVSRATFREAVRQLEWHGAAVMRRGARGGLEVKAPPRSALLLSIRTYLRLTRVQSHALQDATDILSSAGAGHGENQIVALFLDALQPERASAQERDAPAPVKAPKLSETIALRIIDDLEQRHVAAGELLGSETMFQKQYGVSRSIMREALRPLELHGIIRVKTGAQGGIFVHRVNPDYTVGLADTYLNYARFPLSQLWEAHANLEVAAVQMVSARSHPALVADLQIAFTQLNHAARGHYLTSANLFHQILVDATGNPAIALFSRILLRYTSQILPIPDEAALPRLKEQHGEIIAALAIQDADKAEAIMRDMFETSRRWILKLEAKNPQNP